MKIVPAIVMGLVMSGSVGFYFGLILTSGIKNKIVKIISCGLIAVALGFGLVGACVFDNYADTERWNEGKCVKCNESLHLFDIEHYRNGGTRYHYQCDNGHLITTSTYFENKMGKTPPSF